MIFRIFGIHILSYGEFVEFINMHDRYAATAIVDKQFGSVGSGHYIKIGDGRLCMQWPHAIVGAEPIIFNREGRLRMLRANSLTTLVYTIQLVTLKLQTFRK